VNEALALPLCVRETARSVAEVLLGWRRSAPVTRQYIASSFVDHLLTDHRHHHTYVPEALGRHAAKVLSEDDEIGCFTRLEASIQPLIVICGRREL
jgi:hypothetical protein